MTRRVREYPSDTIVVTFDPRRCIHAARCVRGLPSVFDSAATPWVDPTGAAADEIAEVVSRCPSGALAFRRTDGGAAERPPAENRAAVVADGPLYVTGSLEIVTPGGAENATRVALCRCGASNNKPFCDGSHTRIGFENDGELGPGRLVPAEDRGTSGLVRLRPAPNGPLLVEGPLEITSADGKATSAGIKGALCRCGASEKKPFCDGSHARIGFQAD